MNTFICLLRGINISGQKKIKMAYLKSYFEEIGFKKIITYIQSGNVIFNSKITDPKKIEKLIFDKIKMQYDFEVETIVKTPEELKMVLENNPFIKQNKDESKNYVTFLFNEPAKERILVLKEKDFSPEEYFIDKNIFYFYSPNGYGNAKMNNNFIENKLKVIATTRNWQTVNKLLELSKQN